MPVLHTAIGQVVVEQEVPSPTVFISGGEQIEGQPPAYSFPKWMPFLFLFLAIIFWSASRRTRERTTDGWRWAAGIFLLLALFTGGVILAQQKDDEPRAANSTRTRTRSGACELGAEFGVRIMPPRRTGSEEDIILTTLRPGIRIDSNGHILIKVKDVAVSPYPGTLSFRFFRGPAGATEFFTLSQRVTSDADVLQLLNRPPPRVDAPGTISAQNPSVIERLKLEVSYASETTPGECKPIREEITVVWRYNNSPRDFDCEPLAGNFQTKVRVPPERSRTAFGPEIVDETTGIPGETNKATHTSIFFAIDQPFSCCGVNDKHYTIIQFVRHQWQFDKGPRRSDTWNLDGPESQSARHGHGQEYDPTYTSDPSHGEKTSDEDNEVVHVGPWDASGQSAVIVDDFPGLLEPDHSEFLEKGGFVQWEFVTLLVCKEDHGSSAHYLLNGKARAKTRFKIRRTYPGKGQSPQVSGSLLKGDPEGKPEYYDPCKDLALVLRETGLTNAFNNPRSHRLPLRP